MKILVTGGAGFIGSAIANKLTQEGHQVVIYDVGVWNEKDNGTTYVKGDIFDVVHLSRVVSQCDVVIHMVGLADARTAQEQPQMSFDLNVRSLQVLLESMRGNGIARLILPSSASIYGTVEKSPVIEEAVPNLNGVYPYHKYIAEKLAETYSRYYGIRMTVLRLFNVYGIKGQGILNILMNKAIKGEPVKLFGEKQLRDFIHVSEVANAFASVIELDHEHQVYNVGTGIGRSIESLAEMVKKFFPTLEVQYGEYNGVFFDSVADITKLRDATGFNPDGSDSKLKETIWKQSELSEQAFIGATD